METPEQKSAKTPKQKNKGRFKVSPFSCFRERRGFTLLFAAVTASFLLAVGLAIFNIAMKESLLSELARESQLAFYAADAGIECALYWDLQRDAFNPDPQTAVIQCNGAEDTVGASGSSSFDLELGSLCAHVEVVKTLSPARTEITSYGFNMGCNDTNNRKVQRTIHAVY
jgi:Tfp pilus assembly protein PilX